MGEAKNRGTPQQRVDAAMKRALPAGAPRIRCSRCTLDLQEVQQVDATGLRGIELAFKAHCPKCDQETWAVRGESASVRAFYGALEKAAGQKVQLGSAGRALPE
jgi:hypothetical protein